MPRTLGIVGVPSIQGNPHVERCGEQVQQSEVSKDVVQETHHPAKRMLTRPLSILHLLPIVFRGPHTLHHLRMHGKIPSVGKVWRTDAMGAEPTTEPMGMRGGRLRSPAMLLVREQLRWVPGACKVSQLPYLAEHLGLQALGRHPVSARHGIHPEAPVVTVATGNPPQIDAPPQSSSRRRQGYRLPS